MLVYALPDGGGTIINSAIAVQPAALEAIVALGQPKVLIVPNSFHREDAAVWKAKFPGMLVTCPASARAAVAKLVPVDFDAAELATRYARWRPPFPTRCGLNPDPLCTVAFPGTPLRSTTCTPSRVGHTAGVRLS